MYRRHSRPRAVLGLLGAALLGSCASTDPVFLSPDGRQLRDIDPAPFRVAVAPVRASGRVAEDLKGRGHRVRVTRGGFGGYQAIRFDAERRVYLGASESRKDGHAAGY